MPTATYFRVLVLGELCLLIACNRKARTDLRAEFDRCNMQLKEAQRELAILEKDKVDTRRNHEVELAKKQDEIHLAKSQKDVNEV